MNVSRVATLALTVVVLGAAGAAFAYADGESTEAAVAPGGEPPRRPPARPCMGDDLQRSAWTGVRMPQDPPQAVVVLVSNHRDSRCTLFGSARIRGTDRAGRRVTLAFRPAPRPPGALALYPATLEPGEPGRLVFTPIAGCRPGAVIERIGIEVGGVELPMAGTERIPECAVEIGEWHVLPPPPPSNY